MSAREAKSISFAGLTPLIDTLFILLFCLLALSDTRKTDPTEPVRVQLPEVEAAENGPALAGSRITVEIAADSTIRVGRAGPDGLIVESPAELDRAFNALLGEFLPDEVVIDLQADRDARHGVAVELLQHLRLRGFVNVELVAVGKRGHDGPFGGER